MGGCRFCKGKYISGSLWNISTHIACNNCAQEFMRRTVESITQPITKRTNSCERCLRVATRLYKIRLRKHGEVKTELVCLKCKRKITDKWKKLLESRQEQND